MNIIIFGDINEAVKDLISAESIPKNISHRNRFRIEELSDNDICDLRYRFLKNTPLLVVAKVNKIEYLAFKEDIDFFDYHG